jgi:hypothetical protein
VLKILGRHLLIKACNYFVILLLAFHVSQPYKRTEFTLKLNRRCFVPVEYALEFQILCSASNDMRAFCILVATSGILKCTKLIVPTCVCVCFVYNLASQFEKKTEIVLFKNKVLRKEYNNDVSVMNWKQLYSEGVYNLCFTYCCYAMK